MLNWDEKKGVVGRNNGELWRHLWRGRKNGVVCLPPLLGSCFLALCSANKKLWNIGNRHLTNSCFYMHGVLKVVKNELIMWNGSLLCVKNNLHDLCVHVHWTPWTNKIHILGWNVVFLYSMVLWLPLYLVSRFDCLRYGKCRRQSLKVKISIKV